MSATHPPAPSADLGQVPARLMGHAPLHDDPAAVEQFIARVLGQAHRTVARSAPDEARAILHIAEAFAVELASRNPRFDRLWFMEAATEAPS